MTDFRLCSTCKSHSQAGLCHYTHQLITDQFEPTFAHLRYSLGNCVNLDVRILLSGGNLYNISGIR